MRLFSCSCLLVVLLVCWANARQITFARTRIQDPQQAVVEDPQDILGNTDQAPTPRVQCYGLSRQTRTQTTPTPVLYNRYTGQSTRIPAHIFSLDGRAIDALETQGWEVRVKAVSTPQPVYRRVPVCCPWDVQCQRGDKSPSQANVPSLPCANGGQAVIQNGVTRCQCPPGFRGAWCHIPDLIQRTRTPNQMATGPAIIPYTAPRSNNANNPMLLELMRVAQAWKQRMLNSQGSMPSMVNPYGQSYPQEMAGPYHRDLNRGPMLSPNQHLVLNSLSRQIGQSSPMTQRQAINLKMKMAMMLDWYMKQYGPMMQSQSPQMMAGPTRGGYSPYQGNQLPPMMPGQGNNVHGTGNPYSAIHSHQMTNPQVVAVVNHLRQDPRLATSYGSPYAGPRVNPFNDQLGVKGPKARTPWDLDPFDRHPESKFMRGVPDAPGMKERQMMTLAFYKYMQNIQRARLTALTNGMGMTPMQNDGMIPPMAGRAPQAAILDSIEAPIPVESPAINEAMVNQQQPTDFHATDLGNQPSLPTTNDVNSPTLVEDTLDDVMPNFPAIQPMRDAPIDDVAAPPNAGPMRGQMPPNVGPMGGQMPPNAGPMGGQMPPNSGPMGGQMPPNAGPMGGQMPPNSGPMGGQMPPNAGPMGGQMPPNAGPMGGQMPPGMSGVPPGMPPPPTPEEIRKMEECRPVLVPKIDECMKKTGHDLTLEHFMNPEYMDTARSVCEDSRVVGECVMASDQVCGQGEDVLVTRKMIDSVLHMMGMVCQEITKAGSHPAMPGAGPNVPNMARQGPPTAVVQPSQGPTSRPTVPQEEARPKWVKPQPEQRLTRPTPSPDNPVHPGKTTSKFGHHVTEATSDSHAASQQADNDNGHHGKEPVLSGISVFGFPLWIVLCVSAGLVAMLIMTSVILCVCLRRRRSQKEAVLQTEVTRLPQPLDAKFYTIAVAPPSYPTTVAVRQTEDGLTLPPLDVLDPTQPMKEDDGDASSIHKPPISDDDADDESDDKEYEGGKKKKEKKEKK